MDTLSLNWLRRYAHVPNEFMFIISAALQLLSAKNNLGIDVNVFHSHPSTARLAPIIRKKLGCRTVMVMHGDINDRPIGTYDPRITWWYKITTGRAYRIVDAVIALSTYMANVAIAGGADPNKVYIVPNGVDPTEFGMNGLIEKENPPTSCLQHTNRILFVGRIEYNKGVVLLVEAFARLKANFPNLSLCCIGGQSPPFMRSLRKRIRTLGLEDSMEFVPPVLRRDLGRFYQSAKLVVIPSRSETQSTVLMESMAASKPVVASDTGGNTMIVVENETGLLFPTGDAEGLYEALRQLLSDERQLKLMGEAAKHRCTELYSLEKTAAQLRQVFFEITSNNKRLKRL
jgi:glycosyltransferase involved in cell wall biosynthesis